MPSKASFSVRRPSPAPPHSSRNEGSTKVGIEGYMPNLFAMSFEGTLAPSFDLRCLHPGRKPPDGWGIRYYPGGEPSASVLKEPAPENGSIRSELVKAWDHLASSVFVVHIRPAT